MRIIFENIVIFFMGYVVGGVITLAAVYFYLKQQGILE